MGLFDNLNCDYPLPEGAPTKGYQTKDTPSQYMETYTITEDGGLVDSKGNPVNFRGDLEFYWSNVYGVSPKGYITADDKQAEHWSFSAIFIDGKIVDLRGGKEDQDNYYANPPISREEFFEK